MLVQDDVREKHLVKLFKLYQHTNRKRNELDAYLKHNNKLFKFELKSTTVTAISTASPLSLAHLEKWKTMHWLVGIYDKKQKLQHCYYAPPSMMKAWINKWIEDIKRGMLISDMLVDRIDYEMLNSVFGDKKIYSLSDIKPSLKGLYTPSEYVDLQDVKGGYSKKQLLKMFKESNKAYLYRGSYINNPKIPKAIYSKWHKITNNYDVELRKLLK